MQVSFLALARNPSPSEMLTWRPQTAASDDALQEARAEQAANFADMKRLWDLTGPAYDLGTIAFLSRAPTAAYVRLLACARCPPPTAGRDERNHCPR